MKSARSSWLAALAALTVLAGCSSDDAPDDPPDAAPDATSDAAPDVCRGPAGISIIESLDVGTLANTALPDGLVPWNDGDTVTLEPGPQGFLMLVVGSVVRGSGLYDDVPYPEITLTREDGVVVAQTGIFGGGTTVDPLGAWAASDSYLPFEDWPPEDGDVLKLRVNLSCVELERSLVMQLPQ